MKYGGGGGGGGGGDGGGLGGLREMSASRSHDMSSFCFGCSATALTGHPEGWGGGEGEGEGVRELSGQRWGVGWAGLGSWVGRVRA